MQFQFKQFTRRGLKTITGLRQALRKRMFGSVSVLMLSVLGVCHGDTFTSIREMENLFDLEQNLVKALDNYLRHANFELEVMELHYKELSKIESEIGDIEKYAENPVNAYSVIKRMHNEWPVTFKLMSSSPFFEEEANFPDKSVVTEAISRLVQWQLKNKLDAKTLARGLHQGIKPHANLTAEDCLDIAVYCYNNREQKLSVQWLEEALIKITESSGGSAELLVRVLEYTFLAKCLTGDVKGSSAALQSLITDGAQWYIPSAELKQDYQLDKVKQCEAAAKKDLKTKKTKSTSLFKKYNWSTELCHAFRRSTREDICFLQFDLMKLSNMKFEEVSRQLGIQLIHDFLTNDLILDIKESAMTEFKTLKTQGLNGPVPLPNKELVEKVEKRLHTLLGIPEKMLARDNQIFVHGPGGKHTSLNAFKQQMKGNRLGTLFYFMSDVARGGNVVFPTAKVSVEPTKDALLFWVSEDDKMEVKECPVLVGSKWTMTQSIIKEE